MNSTSILILFPDLSTCGEEQPDQLKTSIRNHWPDWEVNKCKYSDLSFERTSSSPNLILSYLSPIELLKRVNLLRNQWSDARIIGMFCAERDRPDVVFQAFEGGLDDFVYCPFREIELLPRIQRALNVPGPKPMCFEPFQRKTLAHMGMLVGESRFFAKAISTIPLVAKVDATVLISGETGTGKELIAREIHNQSFRSENEFVTVNCGAIPDQLFENEFFGHAKGAFTGALSCEKGLLAEAEGGTLFLDEIDSLSQGSQGKLLRFLERREYRPLGSSKNLQADVRVIAATNQDLEKKIAEESFRSDLFYRLNVTRFLLPPLRERKEDIRLLLDHYVQDVTSRYGLHVRGFTDMARRCFEEYHWPGNVRELKNLVESLLITLPAGEVEVKDLPKFLQRERQAEKGVDEKERELLLTTLQSTKWNRTKAAHELHWSRMTLYRKIEKYHLEIPQKRSPHKST